MQQIQHLIPSASELRDHCQLRYTQRRQRSCYCCRLLGVEVPEQPDSIPGLILLRRNIGLFGRSEFFPGRQPLAKAIRDNKFGVVCANNSAFGKMIICPFKLSCWCLCCFVHKAGHGFANANLKCLSQHEPPRRCFLQASVRVTDPGTTDWDAMEERWSYAVLRPIAVAAIQKEFLSSWKDPINHPLQA